MGSLCKTGRQLVIHANLKLLADLLRTTSGFVSFKNSIAKKTISESYLMAEGGGDAETGK